MNTSTCSQLVITNDPPTPHQCVGFADLKRGDGIVIEITLVGLHATCVRPELPSFCVGKVNVSGDVKPPRIVGSEDGQLGVCHATKRLKLCFKGENHRVELVSPFTVCNTPDVHMLKTANKAIIQNSNFFMSN